MKETMILGVYIVVAFWALIVRPAWVIAAFDVMVCLIKRDREGALQTIAARPSRKLWSLDELNRVERECGIGETTEFVYPGHRKGPARPVRLVADVPDSVIPTQTAVASLPRGAGFSSLEILRCTACDVEWTPEAGRFCPRCWSARYTTKRGYSVTDIPADQAAQAMADVTADLRRRVRAAAQIPRADIGTAKTLAEKRAARLRAAMVDVADLTESEIAAMVPKRSRGYLRTSMARTIEDMRDLYGSRPPRGAEAEFGATAARRPEHGGLLPINDWRPRPPKR